MLTSAFHRRGRRGKYYFGKGEKHYFQGPNCRPLNTGTLLKLTEHVQVFCPSSSPAPSLAPAPS